MTGNEPSLPEPFGVDSPAPDAALPGTEEPDPVLNEAALLAVCPELRSAFERTRFTPGAVGELLGQAAAAALDRREPAPVRRRATGPLGTLIRLFLLADDVPREEAAEALAPAGIDALVRAGVLAAVGSRVHTLIDVRPIDLYGRSVWVFSDLDGSYRRHVAEGDHVLGVGQATVSMLRAVPPVAGAVRALDLGTGSGVLALRAAELAEAVIGTDINPRALAMARATVAINQLGSAIEIRDGSWFEPVEGELFDLVIANPPFVIGAGSVDDDYTYRDSGLDLDGASALVVRGAAARLAPGGTAAMLASWVIRDGEDWRGRVASWLPDEGIDAWVVQRDVADPDLYVGTWLRDGGDDPRSDTGARLSTAWLDHLEANGVAGIGFGFVFLRRTDRASDVLAEDLRQGFVDPLGEEALAYFERLARLRSADLRSARLALADDVVLERTEQPGAEGWEATSLVLRRRTGPGWVHEIDEPLAGLLAGLHVSGLALEPLAEMLATATATDPDTLTEGALDALAGLVRHGFVRLA